MARASNRAAVIVLSTAMSAAPAAASQILINGDFETGELDPWYSEQDYAYIDWEIDDDPTDDSDYVAKVNRGADPDYAATRLVHEFDPVPVEDVQAVEFKIAHSFDFIYVFFGYEGFVGQYDEQYIPATYWWDEWTHFDVTDGLTPGRQLDEISFYTSGGFSFSGYARIDDVVIDVIPEPSTLALLITGVGVCGLRKGGRNHV